MKAFCKRSVVTLCAAASLLAGASALAAEGGQLKLPNFDRLADQASESVSITLDPALLGLATRFLDPAKPEDAAAKEAIRGIKGIYVRSFKFEEDFAYPKTDVEMVRKQLSAPGWQQLMEVRSSKEQQRVDIYILVEQERANGLAIIASQPREFTIVNIVGSVDMRKLHELEGQFGIPKLELEEKKQ
jgi:uncharacterized protein DUF4252